jgi:hypothetical protein
MHRYRITVALWNVVRRLAICAALLGGMTLAPHLTQANVIDVSGTIISPIGEPPLDTNGYFGAAGANLAGDSINLQITYDPTQFVCGTIPGPSGCGYYQPTLDGALGETVTVNGASVTFANGGPLSLVGTTLAVDPFIPPGQVSGNIYTATNQVSFGYEYNSGNSQSTSISNLPAPLTGGIGSVAFGLPNQLSNENLSFVAGVSTCAADLRNAVHPQTPSVVVAPDGSSQPTNGTEITAQFIPGSGVSLAQAATDCGVTGFDWQQTIEAIPTPSPYTDGNGSPVTSGTNDPPKAGWSYLIHPSPDFSPNQVHWG